MIKTVSFTRMAQYGQTSNIKSLKFFNKNLLLNGIYFSTVKNYKNKVQCIIDQYDKYHSKQINRTMIEMISADERDKNKLIQLNGAIVI